MVFFLPPHPKSHISENGDKQSCFSSRRETIKTTTSILNNYYAGTGEVLAEMKNRGLRPATLPELLAFGAQFPDEQRKYPIVALGSAWKYFEGCNFVPALVGQDNERRLSLYFDDCFTKWNSAYRFLVEEIH